MRFFQFFNEYSSNLIRFLLDSIVCVRWSPNGEMLASAGDQTAKLLDFKTGKVLFTGNTSDGSNL